MHGPATVGWLLVALCAVTGVSCVLRARGAGCGQRAEARSEAAMGFAMAAMAVPVLWGGTPTLHKASAWAFTAVFGVLLMRELWLMLMATGRHGSMSPAQQLHHLLGGAAMVYMALAMAFGAPAGGAGAHHSEAGGVPVVTGALLAYFAAYVLWTGTRLMPAATGAARPALAGHHGGIRAEAPPVVRHAGVAAGCRVAMGAGMFAMLLTV